MDCQPPTVAGEAHLPRSHIPWDASWEERPELSPTLCCHSWMVGCAPVCETWAGRASQGGSTDLMGWLTYFSFAKSPAEIK